MMQKPLSLAFSPSARQGSLRISRSLGVLLGLSALAYLVATSAVQADCQEGCLTNNNTALGESALLNNRNGNNTAIGYLALFSNTNGFNNTATGDTALDSNATGSANTANGAGALFMNTTGGANTATGDAALYFNTTGSDNAAIGFQALFGNTTGFNNTAIGVFALQRASGNNNIAVGYRAGATLTTGSNNIDISNRGMADDNNRIRIGTTGSQTAAFIAGISGVTVAGGVGVVIDTNGQLGTMTSSARYKEKIEPMGKASDELLSLQPVKFCYKKNLDPKAIPQFGLVAEDVAKVDPDLVARDEEGKPYSVRYEAVNAMLLNEFLKEHRKVEEQGAEIAELKAALAKQAAQIEKVSAQVQASQTGPQLVSATK